MAHTHPIIDTDTHFTIDPITRAITNSGSKKISLMQYDHNSERFSFDISRWVEGHDMMECNRVLIHFINGSNNKQNSSVDIYSVNDMMVNEADPNVITFTWTISQKATKYSGKLSFAVEFSCVTEDGDTAYRWSSGTYDTITIKPGMDNDGLYDDSIPEGYVKPEGSLTITENGTYDISNLETIIVNVNL